MFAHAAHMWEKPLMTKMSRSKFPNLSLFISDEVPRDLQAVLLLKLSVDGLILEYMRSRPLLSLTILPPSLRIFFLFARNDCSSGTAFSHQEAALDAANRCHDP